MSVVDFNYALDAKKRAKAQAKEVTAKVQAGMTGEFRIPDAELEKLIEDSAFEFDMAMHRLNKTDGK